MRYWNPRMAINESSMQLGHPSLRYNFEKYYKFSFIAFTMSPIALVFHL